MAHKVFVSYHHAGDQYYRNEFETMFSSNYGVFISKSVQIGDISGTASTDYVRQKVRDEYLRDSTVTVVLIGSHTWQRKHVDWEISSSVRSTLLSSRSGLMGVLLPTHPSFYTATYDEGITPPRLVRNQECGYAQIYKWSTDPYMVAPQIEKAFNDRNVLQPDNSYPHFKNNKFGNRWM
ncbi:MAG: TIR domain-containing protein [Zetaproteobacteria bacterium]|nr:MAG: TIR domain-containing protein [Zetaproteobacteria bacterium]